MEFHQNFAVLAELPGHAGVDGAVSQQQAGTSWLSLIHFFLDLFIGFIAIVKVSPAGLFSTL